MEDTISKIYLTWEDIEKCVDILAEKIKWEFPNVDSIIGLHRGGLIPAVMLSHKLDIPWVDYVFENTLVVDDINDTGKTLHEAPGVYHAVLHHKVTSKFKTAIHAKIVGDEWLVYPWERQDSKPIQDYLTAPNQTFF
jgi:hypoxanthine phosphoribosyltransferase|tara:strand:+ start:64 stop:474 length:411 start_codon:yes stop_codon:yes gene_type:complete